MSQAYQTDARWPKATREHPCPICAHFDRCLIAPDGGAAKCWRDGGKVHQLANGGNGSPRPANGSGYVGASHRPKPAGPAYPTAEAAIAAAGRSVPGGSLVKEWTYRNAAGDEAMRVARFNLANGSKQFRPVHPDAGGWKIGDPAGPLLLYLLPEIPADGPIYICEGEKACDAARSIGLPATTSAHGSSAAAKSDWSPLAGRDCIILPDNDAAGEKYARDVASILSKLNPPARAKIVPLPDLPVGGDIVEYIEARDSHASGDIRLSVVALTDATAWTDPDALAAEPWPDPLPLPPGLPPVMPFDFALLPTALHGWIADIAERMQCPPDYCAATAMIVAGSLIGRQIAIRPKRHDDWQVVPNLFGAMIGRPSMMKSPAMREVMRPLDRLEIEAKEEYDDAMREHEAASILADARRKVGKESLKKAVKDGADAESLAAELAASDDAPPARKRFRSNDTTVEKLGVILAENPNGVLIFADELISFLRKMERDGHEGDRGFYITAWNGDSRYTYDRIGRGTLDIEAAIVSIAGSIQPGVIADYLRAAVAGGQGDDGLMQRFQLTVWPDPSGTWCNVDRYPDASAKNLAYDAIRRLATLAPADVGAEREDSDSLPYLRFDRDAQEAFNAWWTDLENRNRGGSEHPAIESHLAKYRSLIPSIALIVHLLDGGIGPVPLAAIQRAIGWGRYLESHARRMYSSVTDAPAIAARLLADRIRRGDVADMFAARDVYRMGWSGLDREQTASAIDVLLSIRWIEERTEPTGGRDRTRYAVSPKIRETYPGELTKPTKAPSVSSVSDSFQEHPNFGAVAEGHVPTPGAASNGTLLPGIDPADDAAVGAVRR